MDEETPGNDPEKAGKAKKKTRETPALHPKYPSKIPEFLKHWVFFPPKSRNSLEKAGKIDGK